MSTKNGKSNGQTGSRTKSRSNAGKPNAGKPPGDGRDARGRFTKNAPNALKWKAGEQPRGGRPPRPSYAKLYAGEEARLCQTSKNQSVAWAVQLCKKLGLDPTKTTIGQALVHADMLNRARGRAQFAQIAIERQEGKVPETLIHESSMTLEQIREQIARSTGVPLDLLNGDDS